LIAAARFALRFATLSDLSDVAFVATLAPALLLVCAFDC
jgi:hypothetical protein